MESRCHLRVGEQFDGFVLRPIRAVLPIYQRHLANGSLSRASHAVSALERKGWVTRHPAPAGRRATLVTLTDAGYAKVVASAPAHVETVRRLVIGPLTNQQLNQLGRISETILAQLIPTGEQPAWPDPM